MGNSHGVDVALVFSPKSEVYIAAECVLVSRACWGRDAPGARLDALADALRGSIINLARDGAPGAFLGTPWAAIGAARDAGTLVITADEPRVAAWGEDATRAPLQAVLHELLEDGKRTRNS